MQNDYESMVADRVKDIAEVLSKGKDVEIRTSKDGISVIEIVKKVLK